VSFLTAAGFPGNPRGYHHLFANTFSLLRPVFMGIAAADGKLLWRASRRGDVAVIPTPIYHEWLCVCDFRLWSRLQFISDHGKSGQVSGARGVLEIK